MKDKEDRKREWKRNLKVGLAMVLVSAVSIGGTLAFLSDTSAPKTNVFTGSPGISVDLTEDTFDTTMAGSYTPEMIIPKNPTLTNNSNSECEEWVAMRVDYKFDGTVKTKAELESLVVDTITMSSDWVKLTTQISGNDTAYDIYLYQNKLSKDASATLFEQVKIKNQTDLETNSVYDDVAGKYKDFEITVCGAAIKDDLSITSSLGAIEPGDLPATIDMENLSVTGSDSAKVAIALCQLLKELPTP